MHLLKRIVFLWLITLFLASSAFVFYRHEKGDRLLSVQTGSMAPSIKVGNAVVTHKIATSALKVGDVVSYRNPTDSRVIVSHRIVSINYQTGKIITKGDALAFQDVPFPSYLVVGKVYKVFPHVGSVLDWMHQPLGLMLAVYTPAAIVFLYELHHLRKLYSRPIYRAYGLRLHH